MVRIHGRRVPLVPILLILALAAYGAFWLVGRRGADGAYIEGSGTIEATGVHVASKAPGRISEILAASGDRVDEAAVLVRLDTQEVDAQVAQAEAAVATARVRVRQAEVALRMQRKQSASNVDQADAAKAAAEARVPQARDAAVLQQDQSDQQIASARAALAAAEAAAASATAGRAAVRASLKKAEGDLARANALYRDGAIAAQAVDAARAAVDVLVAQESAAASQESAAARQVEQARAALALAEAAARQVKIRQGDVAVAEAGAGQAEAAAAGARASLDLVPAREQELAAARAALAQAEAALSLARAVRANAVLTSPISGVVLSRNVEPGEVVGAGVPIMTVADLRSVWLRIYVPEAQLGKVRIGQGAEVFVDAFPGRAFPARVTEIASEAEFTPRNVATREERAKLVFAVRLGLPNPEGLLKPGMPADGRIDARRGP